MFDYIKIEGFRSFKSVELELPRLAVLIGPNGGGKSNFVDFLMLMAEAGHGDLAVGINKRGGFQNIASAFGLADEVRIELCFREAFRPVAQPPFVSTPETPEQKALDIRLRIALARLKLGFRVSEERLWVERLDELTLGIVKRDAGRTIFAWGQGLDAEIEESKTVDDTELAIYQVRDPNKYPAPYAVLQGFQQWAFYRDIDVGPDSPVRQPSLIRPGVRVVPNGGNLSSALYSIQQGYPGEWDEVSEILRTAYPIFEKLTVPAGGGDGKVLLRWFERPYEKVGFSANLLSDGTLKLLCLVAILKSPDPPPLICIDEPELGLHPDWIKLVAELLQDAAERTQVIVATHSPQLVAKLDPDQVIVTEKENGETRMERLSAKSLEKWLREFDLADLWLSGHFGGRP